MRICCGQEGLAKAVRRMWRTPAISPVCLRRLLRFVRLRRANDPKGVALGADEELRQQAENSKKQDGYQSLRYCIAPFAGLLVARAKNNCLPIGIVCDVHF